MEVINSGFASYVKKISEDNSLCDITIIVDNDEKSPDNVRETVPVQAHRLVLSVMSGFFHKMFNDNLIKVNQPNIRLAGVPYSIFQKCLRFMYRGFDDTLSSMTLEDGIKFYKIARMLLMDTKVQQCYSKWITKNINKWESQLWAIFSMAVKYDLQEVVLHCKNYVTDVAGELLFFDEFRTVPLSIVQMVLSCENMNCTQAELKKAIKCWISANKIDDHVANELLNSVRSKKDPLFKGEEVKFYNSMKVKVLEVEKQSTTSPATYATEHSYSSELCFRKSVAFVGLTVFFERKWAFTQEIQMKPIELDVQISKLWGSYGKVQSLERTTVVDIGNLLTQRSAHKVSIFFPEIRCDPYTQYKFCFRWKGEGVQPVLHMFGPIAHELATAGESLIWSIYKQQVP